MSPAEMAKFFACALIGATLALGWISWSVEQHITAWWWFPIQISGAMAFFLTGVVWGWWWASGDA